MPTSRFCEKFGMPERTWRRWQAKAGSAAEGSVAAAGAHRGPRHRRRSREGAPGMGASEGLGDDTSRRAPGLAGDRAAATA